VSPRHVVMFSGGLGSWAAAKRVAERHGTDGLVLLFSDVKGGSTSPHSGEDEDTYRFLRDAADNIGAPLVTVTEGRDIWQVFMDDRFLGNSRLANCSKYLKQKPARDWLDTHCTPDTAVYVGIDWSEMERLPGIERSYQPYRASAPMCEPPYIDKHAVKAWVRREGLEPPRLYALGFAHNNCGGGCVRAGQAQFALLLRTNRERYLYWETKEQEVRDHLDKDVTILRDRTDGQNARLTLRAFRERLAADEAGFDQLDFGGCGCFVGGAA
jgi:hypothetical protein